MSNIQNLQVYNPPLKYQLVQNNADFAKYYDDIIKGTQIMLDKCSHGRSKSIMRLMKLMASYIGHPSGYLLIGTTEDNVFQGYIFAIFMPDDPPIVEFVSMYTVPWVANRYKKEVWEVFKAWAKSTGAFSIQTTVIRFPEKFFKWFHEPLGFKKIGYVLEAEL